MDHRQVINKMSTKISTKLSKYETHVKDRLNDVQLWANQGLLDAEIAKRLGIAYSTFREYTKQHNELSATLKSAKAVVDDSVTDSLLKRALGYKFDEVTKEVVNGELVITKIVTKEMQPDTTAQIFWLKNRRPEEWRDRVEHKTTITGNFSMLTANLSLDEQKSLLKNAAIEIESKDVDDSDRITDLSVPQK